MTISSCHCKLLSISRQPIAVLPPYATMDEESDADTSPPLPRLTTGQSSHDAAPLAGQGKRSQSEPEDASPPPPKRKKFFAKEEDVHEDLAVRVEDEHADQAPGNGRKSPVFVDLVDSDDEEKAVASTSRQPIAQQTKSRIPKNGKDFKGERYFGCQSLHLQDPGTRAE